MRRFMKKFETLLMAATYAEANDRKSAVETLKEVFGREQELQKRPELKDRRQDQKEERERLRM
jgi:hypothetical protein